MALTEPERIIFSNTINAGLAPCRHAAFWASVPPSNPIMSKRRGKGLRFLGKIFDFFLTLWKR
jgi:hypothetical protein